MDWYFRQYGLGDGGAYIAAFSLAFSKEFLRGKQRWGAEL